MEKFHHNTERVQLLNKIKLLAGLAYLLLMMSFPTDVLGDEVELEYLSDNLVLINNSPDNEIGVGGSYLVAVDPSLYDELKDTAEFQSWLDYLDAHTKDLVHVDPNADFSGAPQSEVRTYLQEAFADLHFRAIVVLDNGFALPYEEYSYSEQIAPVLRQTFEPYTSLANPTYDTVGESSEGRGIFTLDISNQRVFSAYARTNLFYGIPRFESTEALLDYLSQVTNYPQLPREMLALHSLRLDTADDNAIEPELAMSQIEDVEANGYVIDLNKYNIPTHSEREFLLQVLAGSPNILYLRAHGNTEAIAAGNSYNRAMDILDFAGDGEAPIGTVLAKSCSIAGTSPSSNLGLAGELVSGGRVLQVYSYPTLAMSIETTGTLTPSPAGISIADAALFERQSAFVAGSPLFMEQGMVEGGYSEHSITLSGGALIDVSSIVSGIDPSLQVLEYQIKASGLRDRETASGFTVIRNVELSGGEYRVVYADEFENTVLLKVLAQEPDGAIGILNIEIAVVAAEG